MAQIGVYKIISPGNPYSPKRLAFEFGIQDDEDLMITNKPRLIGLLERRQTFDKEAAYLVLHPTHTFTINFKGL